MWLELHDSVRDHPKLIKAARDLGIPKVHLLGHLTSLWAWTLRMATDGDLSSFDTEDIEIGAEWPGETGKLVEALVRRGWLDRDDDTAGLTIHDWDEYARHLKAAQWKRQERLRKYANGPKGCVYFAAIGKELIKIGYSTNVRRRMEEHKADYQITPVPIAILHGTAQTEALIHEKFASIRDGRWEHFRRTDELVQWIQENAVLVDESWKPISSQAGSSDPPRIQAGSGDPLGIPAGSPRPTRPTRPTRPDQTRPEKNTSAGADVCPERNENPVSQPDRPRQNPRRIAFDYAASQFTGITDADWQAWSEAYPAVDVRVEARRAAIWLRDNPTKRKRNVQGFLSRWLGRTQERGGTRDGPPPGPSEGTTGIRAAMTEFFERHKGDDDND